MASAWRIVLANEAAHAFSGEGPRRYGGRWNSPGTAVVYVSEHQSTAALEVIAHNLPLSADMAYKAFRLEWPNGFTEVLPQGRLPANWRISPPAVETMEIGDRWVREKRSAILAVPSAICPDDRNFLLNPGHPDFKRIRIAPPTDYEFDPRLIGR
jgi:RES domain-containing protein